MNPSPPSAYQTGTHAARGGLGRRVRDAFVRDFSLKALSLVLAVVAWVMVQEERTEEAEAVARLVYVWPEDLILTHKTVDQVKVRVTGSRTELKEVEGRRLSYRVELADANAGVTTVSLLGQPISGLPREVQVLSVNPSMLRFVFDEKGTAKVPVKPTVRGSPRKGYEVLVLEAEPAEVVVEGAKGALASLDEVPTLPVDVHDRAAPFTANADLDLRGIRAWSQGPGKVLVRVDLQAAREERTFEVPVEVGEPGVDPVPARVKVVLRGPRERLEGIEADAVEVSVRLGAAGAGPVGGGGAVARWGAEPPDAQLVVVVPEGTEVARVEPDRVNVGPRR